jgi:hypothetical protein
VYDPGGSGNNRGPDSSIQDDGHNSKCDNSSPVSPLALPLLNNDAADHIKDDAKSAGNRSIDGDPCDLAFDPGGNHFNSGDEGLGINLARKAVDISPDGNNDDASTSNGNSIDCSISRGNLMYDPGGDSLCGSSSSDDGNHSDQCLGLQRRQQQHRRKRQRCQSDGQRQQ